MVYDCETETETEYDDLTVACKELNLSYYNTGYRMRAGKDLLYPPIYNGLQFKYMNDERHWGSFTTEEILLSKENYQKSLLGKKRPYLT